jgi:ABC-type antimicrobial peptide transport system permease subunit
MVDTMVNMFVTQDMVVKAAGELSSKMTEATMQKTILTKVGELTGKLMEKVGSAFKVDGEKMASAFKFEMDEDEMRRLFQTLSTTTVENADTNLLSLGYQDLEKPTMISFYFKDFESKELFLDFIDDYNEKMEKEDEEKVINFVDITGLLMSSVKTIVDSVSYVLIAFVSISLIVSSIMIGIITYISVLERTKEIGVLRAIGASKRNISSIFNAETFIVGLLSGLIGIGTTLLLLIPTNIIIHNVNEDITAVLPEEGAIILVILSVILTLIGGIIPSKAAAKKDPVLALRSE